MFGQLVNGTGHQRRRAEHRRDARGARRARVPIVAEDTGLDYGRSVYFHLPTAAWRCGPSRREIVSSSGPATVLVVDDSAFMRRVIGEIIDGSPRVPRRGTARNGHDALRQIHALEPDIVTLDVEMPELDGLQTLGYIMSETPRAVVMLSAAATQGGVDLTLRCLELGAVDFVRKPSGPISLDLSSVAETLLDALRAATQVNLSGSAACG